MQFSRTRLSRRHRTKRREKGNGRVDPRRTRQVAPDPQSPRTLMYGFFARQRTDPPQRLCSSGVPTPPSCLRPPPSPTHSSRRVRGHVAFTTLQVLFSGPTTDRASRPISLPLIGLLTPALAGDPASPPRVTTCSSAPCRPHTPWSEGRMDYAFVAVVPTRPGPLFGRPVHHRGCPHRLRPGASPQALRIPPHGGHPALPDHPDRGQRGITPAFGYGALHPSARRTSTSLSTLLPGTHSGPIRHPLVVRPLPGGLPVIGRTQLPSLSRRDEEGFSSCSTCPVSPCCPYHPAEVADGLGQAAAGHAAFARNQGARPSELLSNEATSGFTCVTAR